MIIHMSQGITSKSDAYQRKERNYTIVRFPIRTSFDNSLLLLLVALCDDGYILKVTNWKDSEQDDFYDAQNDMILLLATAGLAMPGCC